jgi:hypothetical protein
MSIHIGVYTHIANGSFRVPIGVAPSELVRVKPGSSIVLRLKGRCRRISVIRRDQPKVSKFPHCAVIPRRRGRRLNGNAAFVLQLPHEVTAAYSMGRVVE